MRTLYTKLFLGMLFSLGVSLYFMNKSVHTMQLTTFAVLFLIAAIVLIASAIIDIRKNENKHK